MKRRLETYILIGVAVLHMLSILFLSPTTVVASENPPASDVAPHSGRPGALFAFYATGFDDRERVAYWFHTPDGRNIGSLSYVVYSHKGRADWMWQTSYDAIPGEWFVVAYGLRSHTQRVIPFEVENPGVVLPDDVPVVPSQPQPVSNPPDVAVEPLEGPPDMRFAFFATGFSSGEKVHFWATDPKGDGYGSDTGYKVMANPEGRADWTWRAPDDAMPGLWSMVAWGAESNVEQVIFFRVVEHER